VAVPELLRRLLETPSPSGYEAPAAAVWRAAAGAFAEVSEDAMGNSYARVGGAGRAPLLALFGHVDEVGLTVTHVDEHGFVRFRPIGGGVLAQSLVAQRVAVITRDGSVPGVIAARRDPARVEEKKAVEIKDLHIDLGARNRDEARRLVRTGDPAVVAAVPVELANGRLAARALDNRLGAYVVLEALRRLAESGEPPPGDVVAVATVQEEVGDLLGARVAAYSLEPGVALAVDVTVATDVPGGDADAAGEQKLGGGPSILRGPGIHARVHDRLAATADEEGIAYTVEVSTGRSMTDQDGVYVSRAGVPSGVVSVATRYVHTPVELLDLADVEGGVRLVEAFARRLGDFGSA
jgi:putative aminopeptidase FrvX